jgi:hypothetical protein
VARSTAKDTNVAGRTEWDGDLELLLVEDKDNLVAKVDREVLLWSWICWL